jgi:glucose 1-dehydrogenase
MCSIHESDKKEIYMRAIVTGAGGGIGRATCLRLNQDSLAREGKGAQIVVLDILSERVDNVCAELRAAGATVVGEVADITLPAACADAAALADRHFGGLDVLVNNAGRGKRVALAELEVADWDDVFALNARAPWLLAKAAYPMLKQSGGRIVSIGSVSGLHPQPGLGPYSPAKAALIMLTKQMALEWGPDGIRVNSVSPGVIHTPLVDWIYKDPERKAARTKFIPQGRVGTPEDIANVIAFLVGPDADYLQGENVVVDGAIGLTAMAQLKG